MLSSSLLATIREGKIIIFFERMPKTYDTSSFVRGWSLITKLSMLLKLIAVTVPSRSKGLVAQTKSAALHSFRRVVLPSS